MSEKIMRSQLDVVDLFSDSDVIDIEQLEKILRPKSQDFLLPKLTQSKFRETILGVELYRIISYLCPDFIRPAIKYAYG